MKPATAIQPPLGFHMLNGIGIIVILLCVFGSFLMSGGNLGVILHALPHEMMAIGGAAVGAFILSNSMATVKRAWQGVVRAFKGPRWQERDYRDLLALMFALLTVFRTGGATAIEPHLDTPANSSIFSRYPRLLRDWSLVEFICDYLRMMTVNFEDPHQIAEAMEADIERHHNEELLPQHALQVMADGLPALGIVAAVLGVIKTMSSIDQPTEILGAMIGGALVGTFLGVLLSYCFVGPIASKLHQIVDADCKPFSIVKTAIIAHAQGLPTQVAVELGRRMTPSSYAPSFMQLEEALDQAKDELSATSSSTDNKAALI
jgi:chemotaxis protein MotA